MSDSSANCRNKVWQFPEYCPETDGPPRPLVLVGIPEESAAEAIVAAAQARKLTFQYRTMAGEGGTCLAVVGRAGCDTDQFLRSLIYALQQAAGEKGEVADILENRLVPTSFSLYGSDAEIEKEGGVSSGDIASRYGLRLAGGSSFGSGLHPSTRLAVQALESLRREHDDLRFPATLDVGCGSGILALVCARLGAPGVLAIDRDPQAVATAAANVTANGLQELVSVQAIAAGDLDVSRELVVANLAVSVLHVLLDDLVRLVAQQGFLVLAGFQKGQGEKILALAKKRGMALMEQFEQQGWRSFLFQKDRERDI